MLQKLQLAVSFNKIVVIDNTTKLKYTQKVGYDLMCIANNK